MALSVVGVERLSDAKAKLRKKRPNLRKQLAVFSDRLPFDDAATALAELPRKAVFVR